MYKSCFSNASASEQLGVSSACSDCFNSSPNSSVTIGRLATVWYFSESGCLLIAMIGEGKTRAQSSILEIQATINQNVASIEIGHNQIIPEYLQYFLIKNYEFHRAIGNGTGPKALNCQKVKEFDFQLPPLQEQCEIVHRVESLFAKADTIESRYQRLKAKIDNLPQVILHKAFNGELVPQLPTDGDAKDLLSEIMALKEEVNGRKKR
jgi:type I restriction enzyme S subunit